jgi:hypothetical protein
LDLSDKIFPDVEEGGSLSSKLVQAFSRFNLIRSSQNRAPCIPFMPDGTANATIGKCHELLPAPEMDILGDKCLINVDI